MDGGIIHRGGGVILGWGGGLYVYGNCLIAMGFEWFESDIFGLAKHFFTCLS
jgi:hypothetical protein